MKQILLHSFLVKGLFLMFAMLVCHEVEATEYTYDFSSAIPSEWTVSTSPYGFETANYARGAQFTSSSTLTLTGVSNVTKVVVTCSTNVASTNSIALSVGGTTWGTETLAKENNVEKTFTGTAASGNVVLSITRESKSVYISKIVVTADEAGNGGGTSTDTTTVAGLDESYTYDEPTEVTVSGATCSNTSYSFVQNNIKVEATTGAQTTSYFGCNAGCDITFTATAAIKGIVINGYVKKEFSATASSGDISYVDASDDAVEADPVVVVTDIDSKSVTLSCDKQLRCYSVEFYFTENPDVEIENGEEEGDYTFEYEPTTPTSLAITFDSLQYADYSAEAGYDYTDLYFMADEYEMELAVFAPTVKGTAIAPGTYQITDTYEDGTVQASPGGDDYYDYPAYISTGFIYDSDYDAWYYTTAYYIVSGTLTVTSVPSGVKMVVNGTTHYGTTVYTEFTGTPACDGEEDAIESVSAPTATSAKVLRDGRVLIVRDGHTYTTSGLLVK